MKLLIATGVYAPDIGGPATYTKFLERHLPQQGIDVDVIAFTHVRKYPKVIRHIVYLAQLLTKGRSADIIYALDTVSVGVPACIASFILRKKFYLRVPGDYAWEQGQQRFGITETLDEYLVTQKKPFMVGMLAWVQTRVARSATRIVVPSEYMKGVVEKWGVSREKIIRVYSALNPIEILSTKEELRSRFGYRGFVVCTSARLVPWKGIEAVTDAVAKLHNSGVDIQFEIIGDGTLREYLTKHVEALHAESYIHLSGKLPKQALADRIKASDVFVLNTSYEGLSHQLLEVMDIGVPIITTPVGGNMELIADRKEGLIVPFNDREAVVKALMEFHEDGEFRERVVGNAREKAKLFREEVIISEVLNLFA